MERGKVVDERGKDQGSQDPLHFTTNKSSKNNFSPCHNGVLSLSLKEVLAYLILAVVCVSLDITVALVAQL